MKTYLYLLLALLSVQNVCSKELKVFTQWESDGPGALEHGISWTHDNAYYVTHGYGFSPFQGIQSSELWSLDMTNQSWKQLPVIGKVPNGNGRGVKRGNKNEILALTKEKVYFGRRDISYLSLLTIKNGMGHWQQVELLIRNEEEADLVMEFSLRDPQLSSLIYNDKDDSFYSICGRANCDVYKIKLDGNKALITKVSVQGDIPSSRVAFAYGYSTIKNQFVMVSGQNTAQGSTSLFSSELWVFDFTNSSWEKKDIPFTGRRNPCFAFDQKSQDMIIWGGTEDGVTSLKNVELYNLKTSSFKTIAVSTNKERSSCFGTYDSKNQRALFGFGNSINETGDDLVVFKDLWTISY